MGWPEIISNTVAQVKAMGFREAENRNPSAKQAEEGADRTFQVTVTPATEFLPRLAIPNNIRRAIATISMAYFRGGGDAGGATGGGDRMAVLCRAQDDLLTIAGRLEFDTTYDTQNSGIRRRVFQQVSRSADLPRSEIWDLAMLVEWEANELPEATP